MNTYLRERRLKRKDLSVVTPSFLEVDRVLSRAYRFKNPYSMCRRVLQKSGKEDVYVYGETPLCALYKMGRIASITKSDRIYELGCGRGRASFFLNSLFGCEVIGIEQVGAFVEKGNQVAHIVGNKRVRFYQADVLDDRWDRPTLFYVCGTCFEYGVLEKLSEKIKKHQGVRVLSISESMPGMQVVKSFGVSFPWGTTLCYLNQ